MIIGFFMFFFFVLLFPPKKKETDKDVKDVSKLLLAGSLQPARMDTPSMPAPTQYSDLAPNHSRKI